MPQMVNALEPNHGDGSVTSPLTLPSARPWRDFLPADLRRHLASDEKAPHTTKDSTDDRGPRPDHVLRQEDGGRRCHVHRAPRQSHRLPRPERCREVHNDAVDRRSGPPHPRHGNRQRPSLRPTPRATARGRPAAGRQSRSTPVEAPTTTCSPWARHTESAGRESRRSWR